MAKKKPDSKKLPKSLPPELHELVGLDPVSLQRLLNNLPASEMSEPEIPLSPEERAQQLAFEASGSDDPTERAQLARQALEVWPDCADAYLVLSDEAESDSERLKLCQAAVAAGRRAIGDQAFQEHRGAFWQVMETRPYMRAMIELSNALWLSGQRDEAIVPLREMLRLNPGDNQGARYLLLSHLLFQNRNDEAAAILAEYPDDDGADWAYSRALLLYRQEGATRAASKALRTARKLNRFVPEYLVGSAVLPESPPESFVLGDRSEAEAYSGEYLRHWRDTPGAIPWLRETLQVKRPRAAQGEIDKRTWSRLKAQLAELPQDESDLWHVGCELVAVPGEEGDPPATDQSVWALVALSPVRQEVVSSEVSETRPKRNQLLVWLAEAMLRPQGEDPRRPASVRVREASLCKALQPWLTQVGIECELKSPLEDVRLFIEFLSQNTEPSAPSAEVSAPSDDASLLDLPQSDEPWQLDQRLLAVFIGNRGTPQRPWTVLIGDPTNRVVIAKDIGTTEPTSESLQAVVRRGMASPSSGDPRRPTEIQVATVQQREDLGDWLESLGVRCVVRENLQFLDYLFTDITRHLAGEGVPPGILTTPGVQPEHAAGVFDAAAEFYRAAPWRIAPADTPLKIVSPSFESGPWYATVMGQSGMLQGLALYEDYELLKKMLTGSLSESESRRQHTALAVHFGEAFDIPPNDLQDQERLGWQIAGPEAYPTLLRVNPGMNIRRPLAWELKLLEACLRAVPAFVSRPDRNPATYTIATCAGPVPLTMSWCS